MSAPAVPEPTPTPEELERERKRAAVEELAAAKADMTSTIGRQIEFLVQAYANSETPLTAAQAGERARSLAPFDPLEQGPEHVSWHSLANLMEHDPERGRAVWEAVKADARKELRTGLRTARALERPMTGTPHERAQFSVILEALREDLRPRGGTEELLVQRMAAAYEQQIRWDEIGTRRVQEESWHGERDVRNRLERMSKREREHYQDYHSGWLPPRQSDAEAIEQAMMMADRYGRQFLRLLRTFREMRRVLGTVVMTGGQLNVAEQQIVANAAAEERE